MIRFFSRRSACLVALLLLAAACSSGSDGVGVEDPPASSPAVGTTSPEVLRFSAPKLGGGTVHGEDYSGHDVAIWFWAPW